MSLNYENLQSYDYDPYTMRELELYQEKGYDSKSYLKAGYRGKTLEALRVAKENGIDLKAYLQMGFHDEQLIQIVSALKDKLPIRQYIEPDMLDAQIEQIVFGLRANVDVELYAKMAYNWMQMREIRLGLEHNIDVSLYIDQYFGYMQMKEIREGLEEGLDVSSYAKIIFSTSDMRKKHQELRVKFGIKGVDSDLIDAISDLVDFEKSYTSEEPCEVLISSDKMTAYMMLNQPFNDVDYRINEVLDCLKAHGVLFGIRVDVVEDAVRKHRYDENISVAFAKEPIPGRNGFYDYLFRYNLTRKPKKNEDGSVNYRDLDLFELVKEGQVIAKYHHAQPGEPGISVEGKEIPALNGGELPVLRGSGFHISADKSTYYAEITGSISMEDYTIHINKEYVIDGDLTLTSGNISFDGNVIVRGNVCPGVILEASNDIRICGIVEGATVTCNGILTVEAGVLGNQKAVLTSGGNMYCMFVENAIIKAGEDFYANYLLNSDVRAMKKIMITGRKGTIIGGYTYAGEQIDAVILGNKVGTRTEIELGLCSDYTKREYDKYAEQKKCEENLKKLIECKSALDNTDMNESCAKYYGRVSQAIEMEKEYSKRLEKEMNELREERERLRQARLFVRYEAFPGCLVTINGKAKKME